MPKNIPWEQKERWCGRFERGDSVAMMAREYRKDPRTVQRGIDDVRRHRATTDAREALLRESLRHHLEDLLVLVERVARSVVSPPTHLELRFPGVEIAPFLDIGPVRVDRHGDTFDVVTLEVEQEFTWGLLKEHLGRDRTFRLLARWKQAFSEALNAHLVFRDGLLTVLEDFGLRISDDLLQPGTVRPAAAEELVKAAVSQILLEDPPYELQLKQGENGEFLLNRGTGGRLLPDSEAAQEVVNGVLDSMISSQPAQALRQANHRAAEQAGSLREALELVRASYYLPGTCRACRRYGGI